MIFSIGDTTPDQVTLNTFKPTKRGVIIDFHKGANDVFFVIRIGDEIIKEDIYQEAFLEKMTNLVIDEVKRNMKDLLKEVK